MRLFNDWKLRYKLLAMVLPVVVATIVAVGTVVGYIADELAYQGMTRASQADLEHMGEFALDLLNAHRQQFEVYRQDKKETVNRDLATMVNLALGLAEAQHAQHRAGRIDLATATRAARGAIKKVSVGASGYLYAMTSQGVLTAHVASEGADISASQDESGRYFIREMCQRALAAPPGEVLYIVYPWKNAVLGDQHPRQKVVAYRYFAPWDWIIAAGSYLDETSEDLSFERRSLEELKARLKAKRVGETGYIYAMTSHGELTIHPSREGQNIYQERDDDGRPFIQEMCEQKRGWIRYPWKNPGEPTPRMKLVRYEYFEPWDWIVAVGSYEDEFYREADKIRWRLLASMVLLTFVGVVVAEGLVVVAARRLTGPIEQMIAVIRKVKRGRLEEKMVVNSGDELGELAGAFNRMTDILKRNQAIEATLAQQSKMASLGVLSSGVAHEINNPLGVILGLSGYLDGKLPADDPHREHIQEIRRESQRCKKIVQDLLSYARIPRPCLEETDVNALLEQIMDFAAAHTDMQNVELVRSFAPGLPAVWLDPDQLRQVTINLILNAGAAMPDGGRVEVRTARRDDGRVELSFRDTGGGIPPEELEKVFEPFFTTRARGTGLGLPITRQIVERHRGEIGIESEVGRGTVVTVILPVRPEVA